MKNTFYLFLLLAGCANAPGEAALASNEKVETPAAEAAKVRHFVGSISNGMKGDSIFFDVSADGKRLENLTFKGYWRCSGKLEQTTVGPDGAFNINGGKVDDQISEPPGGGSTAWRFDLQADIAPTKASGTFRMNINNLGCDTYKLQWTAVAKK